MNGESLGGPKPLEARSPHWPAVERAHLVKEPTCQVCGTHHGLQVHHIQPFHLFPLLELDPTNLITFCEPHHLLFGHLMLWKSFNSKVRLDAEVWRVKITARPGN